MTIERRFLRSGEHEAADRRVQVEIRMEDGDGGPKIRGHAAVFNSPTTIFGSRELVRPGAFAKTIREGDARGLFNHDQDWLLGRVKSGTMRLVEDETGLAYEIDPPDTALIRELVVEPIRRGDLDGSSFGFRVVRERVTDLGEFHQREILEAEVFDVGPVTFPAYEATDADFRSMLREARSLREVELLATFRNSRLTDAEIVGILERTMELIGEVPRDQRPNVPTPLGLLARRLDLAALEV